MASEGLSWLRGLGLEECRGLEEFGVQGLRSHNSDLPADVSRSREINELAHGYTYDPSTDANGLQ